MKLRCPSCAQPFALENVNIQTDVALCKGCGHLARVSELADDDFSPDIVHAPPKGAWFRQTTAETVVGASTRHPSAFFLVPFMCVWSGFSLGGIYGPQITKGEFNLLLSLFGLPFLAGTILFGSIALMSICGKVEVRLRGRNGVIFAGVGPVGWKRAFNLDDVETITEDAAEANYPGNGGGCIALLGATRLRFGSNLNENRRRFIFTVLKAVKSRRLTT